MRRVGIAGGIATVFIAVLVLVSRAPTESRVGSDRTLPETADGQQRQDPRGSGSASSQREHTPSRSEPVPTSGSAPAAETPLPRIRDIKDFPKLAWHLNEQDFLLELYEGHIAKMRFFGNGMKSILIRTPEQIEVATLYAHACDSCEILAEEFVANAVLDGTYDAIIDDKKAAESHAKGVHNSKVVEASTYKWAVVSLQPLYESEEYKEVIERRKEALGELNGRTGHYRVLNESERCQP